MPNPNRFRGALNRKERHDELRRAIQVPQFSPELIRLHERRNAILEKNLPPSSIEMTVILPRIESEIEQLENSGE